MVCGATLLSGDLNTMCASETLILASRDVGIHETRVPTHPGKSGFFPMDFPGPGKCWKISLVLESPGNESLRSWKVLENEDPG